MEAPLRREVAAVTVREHVGWRVPTVERDAFVDWIHDEYGQEKLYTGVEAEAAIREWIGADDYAAVEDVVDRLIRAAGRTPEDLGQKKTGWAPPDGSDTTLVQWRVHRDVKAEFAAYVRRTSDDPPGVGLARALRQYREGGRARRIRDKLDRVSDDAEALLAELNPDDDGGLSLRDRRTVAICQQLRAQEANGELSAVSRERLEAAIGAVAGDSAPTIREYTDRVIDRLGFVQHPATTDVFVSKTRVREIAENTIPDVPPDVRTRGES